ncbi:hypothetical protein [Methylomarinum vadi]|uniref:hypothetical protein n=1 Tax=Methylomarinum vadi TaxID=438855 RepID=UPI0004DFCC0F|nr:hypothetical protein [Methylomarinum vadi]
MAKLPFTFNLELFDAKVSFENDGLKGLAEYIRRDEPLSRETKEFIADVMEGKIIRPRGQQPNKNLLRNWDIAYEINKLLRQNTDLNLTSNANSNGAAEIVASKYKGVTEDSAIKIYQKLKSLIEESEEI